jgi:hypothetical protein
MTTLLCRLPGVVLVLAALAHPLGAMSQQDRSAYLNWMLKSLPSAPQFEQWQQRTGELPPDFEAFPPNNFLPDPLTFMNGRFSQRNRLSIIEYPTRGQIVRPRLAVHLRGCPQKMNVPNRVAVTMSSRPSRFRSTGRTSEPVPDWL